MWTTKKGIKIPESELDTDHLINIVKMLLRNMEKLRQNYILRMMRGIQPHGECAQDCFELELSNLEEADHEELMKAFYPKIVKECNRRRIKWKEYINE